MSFCSNCGKELMDGAAFCEECGTPVEQPRGAAAPSGTAAYASRTQAAATDDGTGLSSVQNLPFHIIGGAVFVVVALIDLYWSLRYGFVGWMFIVALLDIAFAVALFARIKKPVIQIAMGIEILVQLWRIIRALSYGWYSVLVPAQVVGIYGSYDSTEEKFNLLCMLPDILVLFAFITACLIAVIIGMGVMKEFKALAEKIWFVPSAIYVASILASILVQVLYVKNDTYVIDISFYNWYGFTDVLYDLLVSVGIAAVILFLIKGKASELNWTASPAAGTYAGATYTAGANATGNYDAGVQYSVQNGNNPAGFYSLVTHGLLLIFTLGIWQFIWIYRTTQLLNCVQDEPPRNPTTKLLLCIFVPFYTIYWVYKHAKYIDSLAASKGVPSDLATLCLIMMFLVPIVPLVLMQDKINNIAMKTN